MNTNPSAITILCYGDSNTWGQRPEMTGRFAADVRWPGVLQNALSAGYYVIEEGLSGRTTDIDRDDKPGKNGREYLLPCLGSHEPLDLVIIMLGTNDMKERFQRDAAGIAESLGRLVDGVRAHAADKRGNEPLVLLVSTIHINPEASGYSDKYRETYSDRSVRVSHELAPALAEVARVKGADFIDASEFARPGEDGVHMDAESHAALGRAIVNKLGGHFGSR